MKCITKYQPLLKKPLAGSVLKFHLLLFISTVAQIPGLGQGDGPRSFLLAPKDLWGINLKWINMDQNISPSGNVLLKQADIKVNVFPVILFHMFEIKGRIAQVLFAAIPGRTSGSLYPAQQGLPNPSFEAGGFADGFIGFKVGLVGSPALDPTSFAQKKSGFSMMTYTRVWHPGTYHSDQPISLGTNWVTFQFSFPMAVPLGQNVKTPFWLEIVPSIDFSTPNNNPPDITQGSKLYRGPNLIYTEAEYRFPISKCGGILGGVLFVNATTADRADGSVKLFEYIAPGIGTGLRIMVDKRSRTNLQVDIGFGKHSGGFYLGATETF